MQYDLQSLIFIDLVIIWKQTTLFYLNFVNLNWLSLFFEIAFMNVCRIMFVQFYLYIFWKIYDNLRIKRIILNLVFRMIWKILIK